MIDFGMLLNRQLLLTEAAREGARVAALTGSASQASDRATTFLGDSGLGSTTVTAVTVCDATSTPSSAPAEVDLSYAYTPLTPLGDLMNYSFTLTAKGVMSCVG
ncbi:hypothetical protein [Actinoplanes friuliensis]|uniref:TadE family protein n=1 Tax=Actinoplanes friuliensis DSM 7358 TaxID=1246995 RepID=U5VS70_9ACTN|nr:hypothetical protein [Actinoplanes friuliensis]AGZ39652.1 hypothetical protein AFR_06815 [Actinoplanes friuliensis DSM 7358]